MSMGEVERVSIGAGSTVEFEPGGNHVMLVGITDPLERGQTFTLQLTMSSGRTIETDVVVADHPPG
jgi:copper(I)-binding protein